MSTTYDVSDATYRYRTSDGEESDLDGDTVRLSEDFSVVATGEDGELTMAMNPVTHEVIVRADAETADTEGVA